MSVVIRPPTPPGMDQEPGSVRERMLRDLPELEKTVSPREAAEPPLVSSGALHERAFTLLCAMTPEARARGGYQQVADQMGQSVARLRQWAERYQWTARLAEHDHKMAHLAREAAALEIAQKARTLTNNLYGMAQDCLVIAHTVFRDYLDEKTGGLKKTVAISEVPDIIKVGLLCAHAGADLTATLGLEPSGQPMDAAAWSEALATVEPQKRLVMLQGLKAARALRTKEA